MVKKPLIFLLVLLFVSVFALGFSEILTFNWGEDEGKLGYRLEHSARYGPSDFLLRDNNFYILDRENCQIKGYDLVLGKEFVFAHVDPFTDCFAISDDFYAFYNGDEIKIFNNKTSRSSGVISKPDNILVVTNMVIDNGILYTRDEKGYFHAVLDIYEQEHLDYIENIKAIYQNGEFVPAFIIKEDEYTFKIIVNQMDEIILKYGAQLGAGQILYVSEHYVLILTEEIMSFDPILAREMLLLVDYSGNVLNKIDIPFQYYTYFPNNIRIYNNEIYYLLSSKQGLSVINEAIHNVYNSKSGAILEKYSGEYHFNDDLLIIDEDFEQKGFDAPKSENSITRTQILNNAVVFESSTWTATSSNLSYGIKTLPDGSKIRTPAWVTTGWKKGVPYKWGGWTALSTFLTRVSQGKYAGDNYTSSVSWSDNYCVGVDCSGFVSRAWNTKQKYGTSTLVNISTAYSSFGSLKRGDIVNRASSHVRLVVNDNPSGTVNTIEASAADWKVSYRNFTYSQLSGYSPRYFNWVINDPPPATDRVMMVVNTSTLNVRSGPSTGYTVLTTIAGNQKFVSSEVSNGWHKLHMPSGDGFSFGWASGSYLTASPQHGYVTVINTNTLNVRSGPGTNYPIITTISRNQKFAVIGSASNGWYEFSLPASSGSIRRGWASGSYLQRSY